MPAPINHDPETGNWKRLVAALLVLFIVGGTVLYAATLPARRDQPISAQDDTPQVQGDQTAAAGPDSEYVPPEDVKPTTAPASDAPQVTYRITQTVDGDTVKADIDGKIETIRLIGIDTPETKDPRKSVQCFGQAASDYTKAGLLGQSVRLEADESQQNRDKYGRLLRYIFLADGTNFNEKLVAEGYAYEYTYRVPYQYQADFKDDQAAASAAQKGLWSPNTCSGKR